MKAGIAAAVAVALISVLIISVATAFVGFFVLLGGWLSPDIWAVRRTR